MSELIIVHNKLERAIEIMNEVADWGRKQGYPVWSKESLTEDRLQNEDTKPEYFCVGQIDGKDACSFIIQWKDTQLWPDAKEGEAAYLHKFCVRREFAHQHMTKKVIEALKKECRAKGIGRIRLDTGWNKEKVKSIYLDAGFHIVKKHICESGYEMALYEMNV